MIQNDYLIDVDRLKQFGKQPLMIQQLSAQNCHSQNFLQHLKVRNVREYCSLSLWKLLTDSRFIVGIFVFPWPSWCCRVIVVRFLKTLGALMDLLEISERQQTTFYSCPRYSRAATYSLLSSPQVIVDCCHNNITSEYITPIYHQSAHMSHQHQKLAQIMQKSSRVLFHINYSPRYNCFIFYFFINMTTWYFQRVLP